MNPLMNPVGSNAEGKLNCINAVVITQKATTIFVRRLPLLLCFSPFLSTILLAFCYAVRFFNIHLPAQLSAENPAA